MNDFERKMEAQMAKYFRDQEATKKIIENELQKDIITKPEVKLSPERMFHLYTQATLAKSLPIFDMFDATPLEKDTIALIYLSKINSAEPEFAIIIGVNLKHNIRWNYEYTFNAIRNNIINYKINQSFPDWMKTHVVTKWLIGEELASVP